MQSNPKIGIIGAGPSELMAGRILRQQGVDVTLFDKARRPGGRANTREHLAMDRDEAAPALLREFPALFGGVPSVVFQRAHRWAFAVPSDPVPHGAFFFDGNIGIGACGDWCMGGRVEGALLSGMAMAHQVLAQLEGAENSNR